MANKMNQSIKMWDVMLLNLACYPKLYLTDKASQVGPRCLWLLMWHILP